MSEAIIAAVPYVWKVITGLIGAVTGLLFWSFKGMRNDINNLKSDLVKHEIESAEWKGSLTQSVIGIHEAVGEMKSDIKSLHSDIKEIIKKK